MTNAEKYLKDGVSVKELTEAIRSHYYNSPFESELESVESFWEEPVKPTLTEDEKVILRNIDNRYTHIQKDNGLWIVNHADEYESELLTFEEYDHLFQFIKNGEEHSIEELLKGE